MFSHVRTAAFSLSFRYSFAVFPPQPLLSCPFLLCPRLHRPLHPALSRRARRRRSSPRHPRTDPAPGPETPPPQSRAGSGSRTHPRSDPAGPGPPPRPARARGRAPVLPFAAPPPPPGPVRGPATAPSAAGPARGGGGGEGGGEAAECAASRGIKREERGTRGGKDGPGWGGSRSRSRPPRSTRVASAPGPRVESLGAAAARRLRAHVLPAAAAGSPHPRRARTFDFMMGGNIPLAVRIRASPSVRICQG
ncbi:LHFPL tetraspan subfamily member 6 protein isoform X1 [Prinia subflava]|uniref:LHFPL tetraspan subfamily member 6 protein isoform X1 n=1 Tax=Prinia subflava TaxID=208062 RepID=UPI002FE3EA2D